MFNEEILEEKLKYLVMSELQGKFDILTLRIDFQYSDFKTKKNLTMYDVDVKFDYILSIDSLASDFGYDINKMSDLLRESLQKYQINKEGKIVTDSEYIVGDGLIWSVEFEADVKHIFEMSFTVDLDS